MEGKNFVNLPTNSPRKHPPHHGVAGFRSERFCGPFFVALPCSFAVLFLYRFTTTPCFPWTFTK